jgi:hypothetical protein
MTVSCDRSSTSLAISAMTTYSVQMLEFRELEKTAYAASLAP